MTSSPGASRLTSGSSMREVAEVGLDRLGDAGVLELDRDLVAVERDRAVDLADRGGGERLLLEGLEVVADLAAELLLEQLADLLERERRDVVAQRGERRLELLALRLRDRGEVDGGEDLADLHRRAAQLAELLDELAGERGGALAGGGVGVLGERRRLAARVPAQRADWPATRPPTRAERAMRLEEGSRPSNSRVRSPAPRGTID